MFSLVDLRVLSHPISVYLIIFSDISDTSALYSISICLCVLVFVCFHILPLPPLGVYFDFVGFCLQVEILSAYTLCQHAGNKVLIHYETSNDIDCIEIQI